MPHYEVNRPGLRQARRLVDSGHYDVDTPWSEAAPSAKQENEQIEKHGYEGYGNWHLAVDTEASEETKSRYGFPYGDFRRLNRAALIHAKQRASQNGHDEVADAAGDLLRHLDEKAQS